MTVKQVIKKLESEHERAKKLDFVRNPLAWALYQVWKMADADHPTEKGGEG